MLKIATVILSIVIVSVMPSVFAGHVDDIDRYYKVENQRGEIVSVHYYSIHPLIDRGYLIDMPECLECPKCYEGLCEECNIGVCEIVEPVIEEKFYRHGPYSIVDGKIMINDVMPSNFNAFVDFDKKKYSTDDLLKITIMFPGHNQNDDVVEEINSDMGLITIESRGDEVTEFKFVETHPDSGIFKGEILTFDFRNPELTKYEDQERDIFSPTYPTVLEAIPNGGVTLRLIVSDIQTVSASANFDGANFYNYP